MTQATQILESGFDIGLLDNPAGSAPKLHKLVLAYAEDGETELHGFYIDSKDCAEYQEETRRIRVEGLKRSAKRKTAIDASTDTGANTIADMIEDNDVALAASVVKGWFGFKDKGQDAQFNKAIVLKMFQAKPTWKDKVSAALEKESNFL